MQVRGRRRLFLRDCCASSVCARFSEVNKQQRYASVAAVRCSVGRVDGVHSSSTKHQLQGTSSTLLLSQAAHKLRHS